MEWRPVPEFPIYEVSDTGLIRRNGHTRHGYLKANGYMEIVLMVDGKRYYRLVHRLVASAFIGPLGKGVEVHHKNSNRAHCERTNLEVVTPGDHATRSHRVLRGEKVWTAKLTPAKVAALRKRHAMGVSRKVLAQEYGVAVSTVARIVTGLYWKIPAQ